MPAATPASEVEVCNLALARVGQKPISSIESPSTWVEDLLALHYPITRRRVFRSYIFNFTKKLAQLTVSATETPAFGYSLAFPLPNDFVRLLELGDYTIDDATPPSLYEMVNGFIYTDEEDDEDTVNIKYVWDNTTVAQWDALATTLVYKELAKDIAFAFTLKQTILDGLENELRDLRLAAAAVAGQEKPPRRVERSRLRDARRMGASTRDTTRHPI